MASEKKYIKIINKGSVHRRLLEIYGLTTKADKKALVGRFGSGFKMAIVTAIRLGLEIVVSSYDSGGPYAIRFRLMEDCFRNDGEDIHTKLLIHYYSDGSVFNTNTDINAFPEWTHAVARDNDIFSILRELFSNALDKDPDFDVLLDIYESDIMLSEKDQTVVYVEQTEAVLDILNDSLKYFKFLGEVYSPFVTVKDVGAVYQKSHDETRFFSQGVLVQHREDYPTLFDYDIFDKKILSESRAMAGHDLHLESMVKLFFGLTASPIGRVMLEQIVKHFIAVPDTYEEEVFKKMDVSNAPDDFKNLCINIFRELFGHNAILPSLESSSNSEAEQLLKYRVVTDFIYGSEQRFFFLELGIETSNDVLKKVMNNIVVREMTEMERERVNFVIDKYLMHIMYYREHLADIPIKVCEDKNKRRTVSGLSNYENIQIEEKLFEDSDLELVTVICHELRHCITKVHDSNYRSFMKAADKEIGILLEKLHRLKEAMSQITSVKTEEDIPVFVEEEI